MKAIVGAEDADRGAFGEELGGGTGSEKFIGIEFVDDLIGVEIEEFNAEAGVLEFGAGGDGVDALGQDVGSGFEWELVSGRGGLASKFGGAERGEGRERGEGERPISIKRASPRTCHSFPRR